MEQATQTTYRLPQSARKHIRRQKAVLRKQHLSNEQREEKISGLYKKFEKPEPKPKQPKKENLAKQEKPQKQAKPKNADAQQKKAKSANADNTKQTKTTATQKSDALKKV